jgi:hypothetical protein
MMMEHLHRHTGRKSLPIHPHADLNFARDINRTASLLHAAVISATKNLPDGISVKYLSSHAKKTEGHIPHFIFETKKKKKKKLLFEV